MDYKELEKKLGKTLKIGDKVWICDYRHRDVSEKAIRHIPPQEVFIVSNEDLPKNKRVYYSDVHFRPVGKGDKPTSKIIGPYDGTGYRMYAGVSLNIFISEKECKKHYKKQCEEVEKLVNDAMESYINKFNQMLKELKEETEKYCK